MQLADDIGAGGIVGVQTFDVGQHDELLRVQRNGECGRGGVRVDVVDAAVVGARHAADHRDAPVVEQPADDARLDVHHVADQADVDLLAVDDRGPALGGEQPGVLTGDADRERSVLVEQPDDVALHLADQHHADDVHRLRCRDAQPAGEHLVMPSRSRCALICGPPPCTTTTRMPA